MMRATSPPTHHPLPLPAPSTSHRADITEADMPPQKRVILTAPTPRFDVGESSAAAAARQLGSTMEDRAAVRAEIEIAALETQAYCHEWQRQDADDHATRHIMRTQALEAGERVDTLEDTGSSA
ncbi:hypothetical protein Tco_1331175 [Tanacetum coccineum]